MDIINYFNSNLDVFLLTIAILSLLVGSFLNVVIYRLPRMMLSEWNQECRQYLGLKPNIHEEKELNLYLPLSHCTHCKARLKPWHNIPVISYFVLLGKCAFCKTKISLRYPIVEFITCLSSVYVAWRFGISIQTVAALIFTWAIISLTFIDLDYHLLPDQLTLFLVWAGLIFSLFPAFTTSYDAILGSVIGYVIFAFIQFLFKLVTGKLGMGKGDFKFLAGMGAFLGWQQLPIIILLASIIGLLFGIIQMIMRRQFKSVPIPFGPYLAVAGWIAMMWGTQILDLYIHKFMT